MLIVNSVSNQFIFIFLTYLPCSSIIISTCCDKIQSKNLSLDLYVESSETQSLKLYTLVIFTYTYDTKYESLSTKLT